MGPNTTIIYTGQIYDKDGKISFTENIDDGTLLIVDGKMLIDDGGGTLELMPIFNQPMVRVVGLI